MTFPEDTSLTTSLLLTCSIPLLLIHLRIQFKVNMTLPLDPLFYLLTVTVTGDEAGAGDIEQASSRILDSGQRSKTHRA